MENKNTKSSSCMACSCPCKMHQEHNHPVEEENTTEAKVCEICGHKHKADDTCDCGCR